MAKTVLQKCAYCGNSFETLLSYVKRGQGRFCNQSCSCTYNNKFRRKLNRLEEPIKWTNNIAYLVGLITSDGNLDKNKKRLRVTNSDFELIEHTRDIVKNEITGRTYKPTELSKNNSVWWNYSFTSHSFYDFCLSIGLMPNKSLILGKVKIPDEYFSHFLRGLIDGDGNYSFNRGKYLNIRIFSGSQLFLTSIFDIIRKKYKLEGGTVYKSKNVFVLNLCNEDSLKILPYIYKDDIYSLTRKKEIINPYLMENEKNLTVKYNQ